MAENTQGGENILPDDLYATVFPYIKSNDRVMNLGCGRHFSFEKLLVAEKKVSLTCIDISTPDEIPPFVDSFEARSVEEPFLFDTPFNAIAFFELVEHIDKTDILLENCWKNLCDGGYLLFSFPNLASIYGRIELLLGYQPHVLEVSNRNGRLGGGIFGRLNNPSGKTVHHIRGITYAAMRELVEYHNFTIVKALGYSYRSFPLFKIFPGIAPINIFICQKQEST